MPSDLCYTVYDIQDLISEKIDHKKDEIVLTLKDSIWVEFDPSGGTEIVLTKEFGLKDFIEKNFVSIDYNGYSFFFEHLDDVYYLCLSDRDAGGINEYANDGDRFQAFYSLINSIEFRPGVDIIEFENSR